MKEFRYFDSARISFFRCGGKIDVFCIVDNISELQFVLNKYKEYSNNILVVGAGSNILIRDSGFHGICIKLAGEFLKLNIEDYCTTRNGSLLSRLNPIRLLHRDNDRHKIVNAGAGVFAGSLSRFATENNLIGAEFMDTIPGTIGGLVRMNAGCFNSEVKDVFHSASVFMDGKVRVMNRDDMRFSYRSSSLPKNSIIMSACFKLEMANGEKLELSKQKISDMRKHRKDNQIVGLTCGSTFTNPKGISAWKLIDEVGLRGYRVGGASFSEKHCNFIINDGTASATDIENLITLVRKKVKSKFDIDLEVEIKIL